MAGELRVLGVLDGRDMPLERLAEWAKSADLVIAADGAAERLLTCNITPEVVVGDLDVLSPSLANQMPHVVENGDQSTTDCDKLLSYVAGEAVSTKICLIGSEGDLPDHVLATYHSAVNSPLDIRFAFRRGYGWILRTDPLHIEASPGTRLSLIPLQQCHGVVMRGVRWPLKGESLAIGRRVSISNEIDDSGRADLALEYGAALIFLETDGTPRWP